MERNLTLQVCWHSTVFFFFFLALKDLVRIHLYSDAALPVPSCYCSSVQTTGIPFCVSISVVDTMWEVFSLFFPFSSLFLPLFSVGA